MQASSTGAARTALQAWRRHEVLAAAGGKFCGIKGNARNFPRLSRFACPNPCDDLFAVVWARCIARGFPDRVAIGPHEMIEAAEGLTNDGFEICFDFLHSTLFERYVQNVIYASILCCFLRRKDPGTLCRQLCARSAGSPRWAVDAELELRPSSSSPLHRMSCMQTSAIPLQRNSACLFIFLCCGTGPVYLILRCCTRPYPCGQGFWPRPWCRPDRRRY